MAKARVKPDPRNFQIFSVHSDFLEMLEKMKSAKPSHINGLRAR